MATHYDVLILGGGPAGEHCAGKLAAGGKRVGLVERELVGGECSYWACIPSKTLLRGPETIAAAGRAEQPAGPVDVAAALAWRDYMVSDFSDAGQEEWLASAGIGLHRGEGRLTGPGAVTVGDEQLTADAVVVATGSDPKLPAFEGLEHPWTSRDVTGLTEVPASVVVLGSGAVGCESAQLLQRLGAQVTLVAHGEHLLTREPPAAGDALARALREDGVDVRLGTSIARVDGADVHLEDGSVVPGERVLLATGRAPRTKDLGLEAAGATIGEHGELVVDARCRAADGLYGIGDVTGVAQLTHVGKYQGRIVAAELLGEGRDADYTAIPAVTFTDPQVASVGRFDAARVGRIALASVARTATYTRRYADEPGFLELHVDEEGVVVGACAVGPEAGEWLGQATLAVRARVPLATLVDTIQPFPTFSEAYVDAALDV